MLRPSQLQMTIILQPGTEHEIAVCLLMTMAGRIPE